MEDKILAGFKKDFSVIKLKGFVKSHRLHNTGIGKTFEDLIGITENNNFLADYKNVLELKSSRELSNSMVTLFTKAPHPKGVNSIIREIYGESDKETGGLKIIHTTVSTLKFNNFFGKFGFKLRIDEDKRRIYLLIKDLEKDKIENIEIYYDFEDIQKIVEKKLDYIAYIKAETKIEKGKEFFKFKKATLLNGLTFDKFIQFIKEGLILYDIRLGVFRSGKKEGKTHDHGSGFRILKNNLDKVFKVQEF
ncbi:MAG: MvaI/BcnI restriction endonuclease family protein [Candidatus Aenigmarchaeota archaeon]|nr:MvaI/BcnI restriction endonuclease family protein [Candidatus Aenigmarchaeota archaeon]